MTVCNTDHGHGYHGHQIESLDMETPEDLGEVHRQGQLGISHPPGTLKISHLLAGFKHHQGEKP